VSSWSGLELYETWLMASKDWLACEGPWYESSWGRSAYESESGYPENFAPHSSVCDFWSKIVRPSLNGLVYL